ncbi:MAG: mercuric transporter MerT family protein [Gemmatimonadota bacterium]
MSSRSGLSTLGAVGAAFASSLCCTGPLLYVFLGVGGAGLASTFEPLRPWFLAVTALFLGFGFYEVYGRRYRCAGEGEAERKRTREKIMLWTGTAMVVAFASFPTWSTWLT